MTPPAWSVQEFEWETECASNATMVSDSPCGTVGGQRTVGIMRSLRGFYGHCAAAWCAKLSVPQAC